MLGALKPHGLLADLDRPTLLAAYYDLLTTLATRQLMFGQSAVLDCLVDEDVVTRWQQLADQHKAQLVVAECVCSVEDEHRRRLEGRRRGIPGWHEVGWPHVERMRAEYPPLASPDLVLDAMEPVESNLGRIRQRLFAR